MLSKQLHLETNTNTNFEIFDTIIPSPIYLGGLLKRPFKEMNFHPNVPQSIMRAISNMIIKVDPVHWICRRIKGFLRSSYQELLKLGFDCPPNNEERCQQILGATFKETSQYLLRDMVKLVSVELWNAVLLQILISVISHHFMDFTA
jgi:hypothetical protein